MTATNLPDIADLTGSGVTEADFKIQLDALFAALRERGDPLGASGYLQNLGLAFSVGASALTCSLKQRDGSTDADAVNVVTVPFRNATASSGAFIMRNVAASLSLTISSGSTLGHSSATASNAYWYLLDSSGTVELAVSSKFFGWSGIVSTTAEGGAGGADSATAMYSATSRSNVPFVCVARTVDTQTTAGDWAAVPTAVHLAPFDLSEVTAALVQSAISTIGGGFVNRFRNGAMDVWQRGTSGTLTAGSPAYAADGWIGSCSGANVSWARTAGRGGTRYALKFTGAASVTDVAAKQRVESYLSAILYPGATAQVTVQAKIYNATGGSITPTLTVKHATAADNWAGTTTDVNAVSLQACPDSALTTVAYTFASASGTANGLEVAIDFGNNFSTSGKSVEISELDIRVTPGVATGLNSSPPPPELRNVAAEFDLCQRYLPAFNGEAGGSEPIGTGGVATGSTAGVIIGKFNTPTRSAVTGITVSSAGHFQATSGVYGFITVASLTFNNASKDGYALNFTVAGGLAGGNFTTLVGNSTSAQILFTGAEL